VNTVRINKETFKELKKLYEETKPGETFIFQGKEILKEYAYLMIEWLETQHKEIIT
jgi:hypothetical protein